MGRNDRRPRVGGRADKIRRRLCERRRKPGPKKKRRNVKTTGGSRAADKTGAQTMTTERNGQLSMYINDNEYSLEAEVGHLRSSSYESWLMKTNLTEADLLMNIDSDDHKESEQAKPPDSPSEFPRKNLGHIIAMTSPEVSTSSTISSYMKENVSGQSPFQSRVGGETRSSKVKPIIPNIVKIPPIDVRYCKAPSPWESMIGSTEVACNVEIGDINVNKKRKESVNKTHSITL